MVRVLEREGNRYQISWRKECFLIHLSAIPQSCFMKNSSNYIPFFVPGYQVSFYRKISATSLCSVFLFLFCFKCWALSSSQSFLFSLTSTRGLLNLPLIGLHFYWKVLLIGYFVTSTFLLLCSWVETGPGKTLTKHICPDLPLGTNKAVWCLQNQCSPFMHLGAWSLLSEGAMTR